ncbi:MAG: lipoyl(octanoyl) transferase LipB [Planctomycetota bacterium]|nr:lipoyl(octanoyl) transferase LipB [Planctomycetota bacterium]
MPDDSQQSCVTLDLVIRDLGSMDYAQAFDLQKQLQQEVIDARGTPREGRMHLLLVEHDPPVITISRRKSARSNLVATPRMLEEAGVELAQTDRGGDITYHGPGQLVVYPILDLNLLNLRLHSYLRFLEQIVIDTLKTFGVQGQRDSEATGVWVESTNKAEGSPSLGSEHAHASKICAMGVRVSRWVTMHGLALNVNPDLSHFDLIIPCGLAGRSVTSLQNELGATSLTMDEAKASIIDGFQLAILEDEA